MGFKKGYIPWNTGLKGITVKSSFKKGHGPVDKKYWNNNKRCKFCGLFLSPRKEHLCKNVDKKTRHCLICGSELKKVGFERNMKICFDCFFILRKKRTLDLRLKLIKQFGGKCQKCDYKKCQECLEFHHKKKEGKIKREYRFGYYKDIQKHPKDFSLFCNRCHREKEVDIRMRREKEKRKINMNPELERRIKKYYHQWMFTKKIKITGFRNNGNCTLYIDGKKLIPKIKHSLHGLEFGSCDRGSADTARSILLQVLPKIAKDLGLNKNQAKEVAEKHYQQFKFDFVNDWKKDIFEIEINVTEWLKRKSILNKYKKGPKICLRQK